MKVKRVWLNPLWNDTLKIVQMYFTCEGRYDRIFVFKFLSRLAGKLQMNFPFFLLKSLNKMSSNVRDKPKMPPHYIFHKRLIKFLIVDHLRK